MVAAVRQQLHFRNGGVRTREHTHRQRRAAACHADIGRIGCVRMKQRGSRNALLKQKQRRLEERVRLEALLHRSRQKHIRERKQAHRLVVRHE